jgi:hypothetical protein
MNYPEAYFAGVQLFNTTHFWHAHEQWEACWLTSHEPDYTFYKGIIQAAAALYHVQKQNPRGLHLNWLKSRTKLVTLPAHHMQLDVQQLIVAMDCFVLNYQQGITLPYPQISLVVEGTP